MKDEFFADIEPVVGVIRVFQRGMVPGVDEYEFSATVVYSNDGKTVELKGVTSNGTSFIKLREAVFKALYVRGVDTLIWDRRSSGGKKRTVIIDLAAFHRRNS